MPLVVLPMLTTCTSASSLGSISKQTRYQDEWQVGAWTWPTRMVRARLKIHLLHVFTRVCALGKRQIAYLSLESRYHCRCRHFSTCWSSPSEPWSAGGWRCLGVLCPRQPQGYSPGWSVHPFELQGSTFKVQKTNKSTNQINVKYYPWLGAC